MATTHPTPVSSFISIEVYLDTNYRPDVDYVDGHIEERNLGEFDHADLQFGIANLLRNNQQEWSIRVVGEARVQVSSTRIRIPDVCVLASGLPRERIIRTPPLLCIEVLSPRDTLKAMLKRAEGYFEMGVKDVWIIDPETRIAYTCTPAGASAFRTGTLRLAGTKVEVIVSDIFSTLDA